jgi:hypothetical protein
MKKWHILLLGGISACCIISSCEEKKREEIPAIEIGKAMETAGDFGIAEYHLPANLSA